MDEYFLHYLWQYGLFNTRGLTTTAGEALALIHRGFHNRDSGADFSMAKIRIGDTLWAGNVEIHLLSSDWHLHGHQHDPSHSNTILHVVWKDDGKGPTELPCLELQGLVPRSVLDRYERLRGGRRWVACEDFKAELESSTALNWVERMATERLEQKHQLVSEIVAAATGDLEYALHRLIFRAFGFKVNAQPMEQLLQGLGMRLLGKVYQHPLAREAVFFGLAGLLSGNFKDEYPQTLKAEFEYQSRKHGLSPLFLQWKTGKIRPPNFPAVRIAQLAGMAHLGSGLLAAITEAESDAQLRALLSAEVHPYWHTHYDFDKESHSQTRKMSDAAIDLLIINAAVPMLFYMGRQSGNALLSERALDLLTSLAPENNRITRQWEACGIKAQNALHSQGLIHLLHEYCTPLSCLHCGIANNILKNGV